MVKAESDTFNVGNIVWDFANRKASVNANGLVNLAEACMPLHVLNDLRHRHLALQIILKDFGIFGEYSHVFGVSY